MADRYPIRPVTADEFAAFRRVRQRAFNSGPLTGAMTRDPAPWCPRVF